MDLAPDPVIDLQDGNKNYFSAFYGYRTVLFEGTFTSVLKIKSQKEVTKQ
jgi:hypothetical protein